MPKIDLLFIPAIERPIIHLKVILVLHMDCVRSYQQYDVSLENQKIREADRPEVSGVISRMLRM
jgi:hypothetical protein